MDIDVEMEELRSFLNGYKSDNKCNNLELAARIGIHASMLSRLLSSNSRANNKTIEKIAAFIVGRKQATKEDLWKVIHAKTGGIPLSTNNRIGIGTGFTTWSAYALSLVYNHHFTYIQEAMNGVRITFCREQNDNGTDALYWLETKESLDRLKNNPDRFRHKFTAHDLVQLLSSGEIDAALMLRPTMDSLSFPKLSHPPVLLSRLLVGYGTYMYVIERNDKKDKKNEIFPIPNAVTIADAIKDFCKRIDGKSVKTLILGNQTIQNDWASFLSDNKVQQALRFSAGDDFINMDNKLYINGIRDFLRPPDNPEDNSKVLLVIAFAPLTHNIYRELEGPEREFPLFYTSYNLSKMVEDKAAYGLYVRTEVLKDPRKLKKVYEFLKAMDFYVKSSGPENLTLTICQQLSDVYYYSPQHTGDNSRLARMQNDLQSLEYSNQTLPLLKHLLPQLSKPKGDLSISGSSRPSNRGNAK